MEAGSLAVAEAEFLAARDRYPTKRQVSDGLARLGRATEASAMRVEADELGRTEIAVPTHCLACGHDPRQTGADGGGLTYAARRATPSSSMEARRTASAAAS